MEAQKAATESAQDSNLTAVVDWFELDVVRNAIENDDTRSDVVEIMNKAVNQPDNEIEVSWWEIDAWASDVDAGNDNAREIISRLSDEAQN